MSQPDKLEEIFRLQEALNRRIGVATHEMTDEQRQRLILPYHALHAAELRFVWRGENRVFKVEPEPWFAEFIRASTGRPDT